MGIDLPTGVPTGHITWASRGWEHPVEGHTPITAPGALEGWRFSDVFRRREVDRRTGYAVRGIVAPRGPENPFPAAWRAIWTAGPEAEVSASMFSPLGRSIRILDGRIVYDAADHGFSGSPTMFVTGTLAIQLLANRLGLRSPRLMVDESSIPAPAELEMLLLEQLHREIGPAVGTTPHEPNVPRLPRTLRT